VVAMLSDSSVGTLVCINDSIGACSSPECSDGCDTILYIQNDGGYVDPILGKQKMTERIELPTSTGAGESKRRKEEFISELDEDMKQMQKNMQEKIQEKMQLHEKFKEMVSENEELTAKINEISAEKVALVDELRAKTNENEELKKVNINNAAEFKEKKDKMAARINELSAEKATLSNDFQAEIEELKKANAILNAGIKNQGGDRSTNNVQEKMTELEDDLRTGCVNFMLRAVNQLRSQPQLMRSHVGFQMQDITPVEDERPRRLWVFRFKANTGEPTLTVEELKSHGWAYVHALIMVPIGGFVYVFWDSGHDSTASWVQQNLEEHFKLSELMIISTQSMLYSGTTYGKHKSWSDAMFKKFLSHIRDAISGTDSPAAAP
jgi:hypothetical protein